MLDYQMGFFIAKSHRNKKKCHPRVFFDDKSGLLSDINALTAAYATHCTHNLTNLLQCSDCEASFEWGPGERTWFVSQKKTTKVIDRFEWNAEFELLTPALLQMLDERQQFVGRLNAKAILEHAATAYAKILSSAETYQVDDSPLYELYDKTLNAMFSIVLEEHDFARGLQKFVESIVFDRDIFAEPRTSK